MRFLTPQIHCSAWKDVHQKTNSLNCAFPFDFLCHQDNNKVWLNNFSMGTWQTTQVYAISPFPIINEAHQTLCFFISFVCSLGNQWFSTPCIVFHSMSKCTTFSKHEHGLSITIGHTVFKKCHGFWVVLWDTISFNQPSCQLPLCVHVSLCHKNLQFIHTTCPYNSIVCHLFLVECFECFECFCSEKKEKKRRSQREKKEEKRVKKGFFMTNNKDFLLEE